MDMDGDMDGGHGWGTWMDNQKKKVSIHPYHNFGIIASLIHDDPISDSLKYCLIDKPQHKL
jgi:hypothetical protein